MADLIQFNGNKSTPTPPTPPEPELDPRIFVVTTLPDVNGKTSSWEVNGYAGIVPPVVMIGSKDGRIECIVPIANLHNVTVKSEE